MVSTGKRIAIIVEKIIATLQIVAHKNIIKKITSYICKYATKGPRSAMDEFSVDNISDNGSHYSKLMSLTLKLMRSREMGAMEARNFLLAEKPYKTDAVFQFLNTVFPQKRKRMLKKLDQIKELPDDSTDLYHGDFISVWYPNRPDIITDMSLFEFAKTYERISKKEAEN